MEKYFLTNQKHRLIQISRTLFSNYLKLFYLLNTGTLTLVWTVVTIAIEVNTSYTHSLLVQTHTLTTSCIHHTHTRYSYTHHTHTHYSYIHSLLIHTLYTHTYYSYTPHTYTLQGHTSNLFTNCRQHFGDKKYPLLLQRTFNTSHPTI